MHNLTDAQGIRRNLEERLNIGQSIDGNLEALLSKNPQAFLRMIQIAPIDHPILAKKILSKVPKLEEKMPANEVYELLSRHLPTLQNQVLELALNRHGNDFWVMQISAIVEGERFGYQHLLLKHKSNDLSLWCKRYAQHGAREGLIAFAKDTGNPLPCAILCQIKAEDEGIKAGIAAFQKKPTSSVLEYLLGAVGPNIKEIASRIAEAFDEEDLPEMLDWYLHS